MQSIPIPLASIPWSNLTGLRLLEIFFFGIFTIIFSRLYLHPLKNIPGPIFARASSLFLYAISYLGIEGRVLRHYHKKYNTKVLRVAPDSVSISDSAAIHTIYIAGSGFQKDERYKNFNLGPVVSIFSAIDNKHRDVRAKPVAALFSPSRLRQACEPDGMMRRCIDEFMVQLHAFKSDRGSSNSAKVDILDLCARLSMDVVTACLMGKPYGGLTEHQALSIDERRKTKLSINPFIKAIVGFSRFSLLPNWLFHLAYDLSNRRASKENAETVESLGRLDKFVQDLVVEAAEDDNAADSYQKRLLATGIDAAEVNAQCKAIIFAGADSVAVMLSTLIFRLVQNPQVLERLADEVSSSAGEILDARNLPYLRAVVNEGLRLGMANPNRFTRVVPPSGLRVGETYIQPGTVVGVAPYLVHHDPDVFPEPFEFRPERWLEGDPLRRPGMEKSMLPFGVGLRACIGKQLAQVQLYETIRAVAESGVLKGATTCKPRIDMIHWFNAEIKGHELELEWKY